MALSSLLRTAILALAAIIGLGTWRIPATSAQAAVGTVIVDQGDTEYLGEWGLATPSGIISGSTRLFTSEKPAGHFSLTVTPPAGATVHIDVFSGDTLTKSDDSRTVAGTLGSGETLKFVLKYDFVLTGEIAVISTPPGLRAVLKGPRGSQTVTTPFSGDGFPEGTYAVTYLLPSGCRPVAPIARNLETHGRVTFNHESSCNVFGGEEPSAEEPPREEAPPAETPPARTENPLRISLRGATREVTAGAAARLTVAVVNRSDEALRNLTVDYRYDGARLSVQSAPHGTMGTDQVTWTIASLAPGAAWEESLVVRTADSLENGAVVGSTVMVLGEDIRDVPSSQRTASTELQVINVLPKTGVPLDLLFLVVSAGTSLGVSTIGALRRG